MSPLSSNHYVAIMAGGIGSRFWPVSRTGYPKQFLDILNTGKTLLQWTVERFAKFVPLENIFIITAREYVDLCKEQVSSIPVENILAEPSRKNTAPCIAYITYKLQQKNPNANLICAPADHLILDVEGFAATCKEAFAFAAKNDAIVTLGIKPTYPNTGYGYIQYEDKEDKALIHKVKLFTEKPNAEIAKAFVASGDFLWNAGIFTATAATLVNAFEQFQPEMAESFHAEMHHFNTAKEAKALAQIYPQCSSISMDYAIMEKAKNVYIIPSDFGWSDLGTWASAYENMEKDYLANAVKGDQVMVIDATHCVVNVPNNKLTVIQGLDEYIVVDTNDVLLICKKSKEQEIKEYVAEVKRNYGDKYL